MMRVTPKEIGWEPNAVYVRPNAYSDPTIPNDIWVECVAVHPPSEAGRKVLLTMDEEKATNFMKELKQALIELRS